MKRNLKSKLCGYFIAALFIVVSILSFQSCHSKRINEKKVSTKVAESGLILGDDLEAIDEGNGKVSIMNIVTGETTIKNIKVDWTTGNGDSLAVFSTNGRRGYYNVYTGKIVVEPKYRRAWVFSEGLAAVQKNGSIGFINSAGEVVIPFDFPYYGNPLYEYVFKNGHCVAANKEGKCGVIDTLGRWIVEPEYDSIDAYKKYAIVMKAGSCSQITYDGKVINDCIFDYISKLTYEDQVLYEKKDGELCHVTKTIDTGLYVYSVGGLCGLMDGDCKRLTEPLYKRITTLDGNVFRCEIAFYSYEVLVNAKGEVVK